MKAKWTITEWNGTEPVVSEREADFGPGRGTETQVLNLYPRMVYQTVEGFGGAFTEAAAHTWSTLPEQAREEVLSAWFGPEGAGYTMGRVPVDSCDFSMGHYCAMREPRDAGLMSFTLDRDEQEIIPFLRAAQEKREAPLTLLFSPWSPPAFMKTNGERDNGGELIADYYPMWAKYLCRYLREYRDRGFRVKYLTIQNEPKASQIWDSCVYTAAQEKEFLEYHLWPLFQKEGLGDVELCIWDHNKERMFERAEEIIDAETIRMVSGVAFHWYSGDHFDAVRMTHDRFPNKKLIFTEGCVEYSRFSDASQLQNAQMYAHDIIGNFNAGMNAWLDWNLLLNEQGGPNHVSNFCDAPLMADGRGGIVKKLSYFYIRHFSRYIHPGAARIGSSLYTDRLEASAFRNPEGDVACVLLNRTEEAMPVTVRLAGRELELNVPASSILTLCID